MRTNEEIRAAIGAPDVASIACIKTAGAAAAPRLPGVGIGATVAWAKYSFADLLISEEEHRALVAAGARAGEVRDELFAKVPVAILLEEVTGRPHSTDQNVALRRGVKVEKLRKALALLEFMGFVIRVGGTTDGQAWEARKPNDSSPRVQRLRAELDRSLDAFLASQVVQALEVEREANKNAHLVN